MREEDVPTQQPEAEEDTRLPPAETHPRGTRGARASAPQGSRQDLRLIWRVRDRAMFRALARGRRRQAGALVVTAVLVGSENEPPRLAFAVNRSVGNAVARNQVRRRLRAAACEERANLRPGWAYLVRVLPSARTATYRELSSALSSALRAHATDTTS